MGGGGGGKTFNLFCEQCALIKTSNLDIQD